MIAINGQFPGPVINVTTNWNVVVNVKNNLDEPILFTWYVCAGMSQHYYLFGLWWLQSEWQCWQCCRDGVQQRRNSWQDGVLGTNCPIPSGWNWTYEFQVKDQIGSFFYFPSTSFQKAAGGFGGFIINNREVIPVPFGAPDGDITIFIGDWYTKSHKVWLIFFCKFIYCRLCYSITSEFTNLTEQQDLRKDLEDGKDLGVPDGVLFNGLGPYRYHDSLVPAGIVYETINVEPGW